MTKKISKKSVAQTVCGECCTHPHPDFSRLRRALIFFHYHSWGNGLAQLDSGTTMILSLRVWFKLLTWWKVCDNDQQLIGDGIEIVLLRLLSENLCMAKRGSNKYNVTSAGSGIRKYCEKRNRAEVASPPFPSFLKVDIFISSSSR